MKLTEEQYKFAISTGTHTLALASAGAGKTATLVYATGHKVENGVDPNNLISFSFTRKASNELRDRTVSYFKSKKSDIDFKYISTIHSFCWNELIKPNYKDVGYTSPPTIIHDMPDEFIDAQMKKEKKKSDRSSFVKKLNQTVSKDLQQEDFSAKETISLLEYMVMNNLVMFDFMIHIANFLLTETFDKSSKKFKGVEYITVDEAQDLNPAQYRFVKLLRETSEKNGNKAWITLVGDFKQSIYKFRGSDPTLINTFVEEFNPNIEILSYNFRSAPEIVELANEIAETIDLGNEALNKSKISVAAQEELEGDVYNIYDVEEFLDELKILEKPLHETCILTRTNQTIKSLAKILTKLEIPYYLHTEFDIMKRAEVKVLMSYLSLVSHGYNKAIVQDIIKAVKGGVPLKVQSSIYKCSSMKEVGRMFRDIKKIPEISNIYSELERGQFHTAIPMIAKMLVTPKKSKEQIQQSLEKFHRDLNDVKKREGLSSWIEALEELMFEAQFLESKSEHKVQLMTIHKAKGLQWKNVLFMYDFSLLEQVENDFYDIEEEKRVVYTAITRPQENLVLWDIDQRTTSELFYKGKLERMVENGIRKGIVDVDDYSHFSDD